MNWEKISRINYDPNKCKKLNKNGARPVIISKVHGYATCWFLTSKFYQVEKNNALIQTFSLDYIKSKFVCKLTSETKLHVWKKGISLFLLF